jgi:hypothetical protein
VGGFGCLPPFCGGRVKGEECERLFRNDLILRRYIIDMSQAFTKDKDLQDDLIAQAWCDLMEAPAECCTEYYMHHAFNSMNKCYMKEWRYRKACKKYCNDYLPSEDAKRMRITRAQKKFLKSVQKMLYSRK